MRVLVGCEFSGVVREAFRALGHDAMSCDLLPTEIPGKHYQGDIRDVLYAGWDMALFFPPCTYLTAAGAHLWKQRQREMAKAFAFVQLLDNAPIPLTAIENPQGWLNSHWRKPDQTIHPYMFGAPWKKRTCLWLRGLPPLTPVNPIDGVRQSWVNSGNNYRNRYGEGWTNGAHRNPKERSRTFTEVAAAMASQWGGAAMVNHNG